MRAFNNSRLINGFLIWMLVITFLTGEAVGKIIAASLIAPAYDIVRPSAVAALTSEVFHTANSPAVVALAWQPAVDNVGVASYTLERSTNPNFADSTTYELGLVTTYRDKTVNPATTYYWRIRAEDANGNVSAEWTTLMKTTLAAPVVNKQLTVEGDSTSTGAYLPGWMLFSTVHSRQSWVYNLGEMLDGTWNVREVAFDGARIIGDIKDDRARQITSYRKPTFERDIVILWAGSNDLYGVRSLGHYPVEPKYLYKAMESYVNACQADGFEAWIMNAYKRAPDSTDNNKERIAFNNLLRADNSFADKFLDVDAWAEFQSNANRTYYQKDGTHPTAAAHQVIAKRVYAELVALPLSISTSALPDGKQGVAYSQSIESGGGSDAKTVSLVKGALPAGLRLMKNTIQGTPRAQGTFTFTLEASDSLGTSVNRAYNLIISE